MLPRPRLLLLAALLCLTVGVLDHASTAARVSPGNQAPSVTRATPPTTAGESGAAAPVTSIKISDAVPPAPGSRGEVFFDTTFPVTYTGGTAVLSSNADGTGYVSVDDGIVVTVTRPDTTIATFDFDYSHGGCYELTGEPPHDITSLFQTGTNEVRVQFVDICGGFHGSGPYWLVQSSAVVDLSGAWDWTDTTSSGLEFRGPATIPEAADGSLSCTLGQGAVFAGTGTRNGATFTLDGTCLCGLSVHFDGAISPDGNALIGTWQQSDGQFGTFVATRSVVPSHRKVIFIQGTTARPTVRSRPTRTDSPTA